MPWNSGDAARFTKKAKSPKAKRQWKDIADNALSRGESDATAIKEANGILKHEKFHNEMAKRLGH